MASFNEILKAELTNDPLARGYAGMTDAQAADRLRVKDRPIERNIVQGYEIINCIESAALAALTSINIQRLMVITSASGGVDIKNPNTRANVSAIFPAGAPNVATRQAMLDLQNGPLISRGQELGLGDVYTGHVTEARGVV